jgi:hypothetical protein
MSVLKHWLLDGWYPGDYYSTRRGKKPLIVHKRKFLINHVSTETLTIVFVLMQNRTIDHYRQVFAHIKRRYQRITNASRFWVEYDNSRRNGISTVKYSRLAVMLRLSINWKSINKTCFYFLVQYTRKCINFTHLSNKPIQLCVIYSKWKTIILGINNRGHMITLKRK